jgi:hypothetical protein
MNCVHKAMAPVKQLAPLQVPPPFRTQVASDSGDQGPSQQHHGFSPVISLRSLKNAFFRTLEMPQLTGTL